MLKIDLKKRKTIKTVAKAAYTAPLTMTLLTSKRALAQSPPCNEQIKIVSVTLEPRTIPVGASDEVTITCVAKSFQNLPLTYTWSTGHTGSTIKIGARSIELQSPIVGGGCTVPIVVTVSDGVCSATDSTIVCFNDTIYPPD